MRLYGLIGYPLTHSFSEKYFTEKFNKERITGSAYRLFPLESIEEFPSLLKNYPELEGLNVTIPYKKQVLPFIGKDHVPEGLKACNCLKIENGVIHGYNTDWTAFRNSISGMLNPHHSAALVLGSGGASEAVQFALKSLDIEVSVVSRTASGDSGYTYEELTGDVMNHHKIIVNTTPLGLYPEIEIGPPIPYDRVTKDHLLYDLIYNPAVTLFLRKGAERGATVKNGEEMLVLQAEESWEIWQNK